MIFFVHSQEECEDKEIFLQQCVNHTSATTNCVWNLIREELIRWTITATFSILARKRHWWDVCHLAPVLVCGHFKSKWCWLLASVLCYFLISAQNLWGRAPPSLCVPSGSRASSQLHCTSQRVGGMARWDAVAVYIQHLWGSLLYLKCQYNV